MTISGLVVRRVKVVVACQYYLELKPEGGVVLCIEPDLVSPNERHLAGVGATARHATWPEDRVGGSRARCEAIAFGDVAAWEVEG